MKWLTVVSVIFLPPTFFTGVHGTNCEVPGGVPLALRRHLYFRLAVAVVAAGLLSLMRRSRIL